MLLLTLLVLLANATFAHAESFRGPVKEIPEGKITGLDFPRSAAVNNDKSSPFYGDVYIVDLSHRVQIFKGNGSFVSTFGWHVNKTKTEKGGSTQQEMDVCTEVEVEAGGECQAGVEGSAPEQFGEQQLSIAVDPLNGNVYVTDFVKSSGGGNSKYGVRVQEFAPEGKWLLEIGKEVNETKRGSGASVEEKNLCTLEEIEVKTVKCGGPAEYEFGNEPIGNRTEPGVFPIGGPFVLAIGGTEGLLYAGAGQRVQEFTAGGTYKSQIALTGQLVTLAVDDSCRLQEPVLTEVTSPTCASFDPTYGDLYLTMESGAFEHSVTVHKVDSQGTSLAEFPLEARSGNPEEFSIDALAVDPSGRLAASEGEVFREPSNPNTPVWKAFGSLIDGVTGRLITEFQIPERHFGTTLQSLAFSTTDTLYGVMEQELLSYKPVPVAELVTSPASCLPSAESETDTRFDCELNGKVNPEGVSNTKAWFQYGPTLELGKESTPQTICTTTCDNTMVTITPTTVSGMPPNQTLYYRLAGRDQNVIAPELLTSNTTLVKTPVVAPHVLGGLNTSFVGSSSSVLYGELNPENAPTRYFFEYASVLGGYCEGTLKTKTLESALYGKIGATLEATGLQPATTYHYRLCAEDEAGNANGATEGEFTTLPSPVPQAITGAYTELATTSATIAGTVNPDGQPATYTFELGIGNSMDTQYVTVFSGPVPASLSPIEEKLGLVGLQPGTEYAFRITIKSGYGQSIGAPVVFTTQGLAVALPVATSPPLLPIPKIKFPTSKEPHHITCRHGYTRTKQNKCVKAKTRRARRKRRER